MSDVDWAEYEAIKRRHSDDGNRGAHSPKANGHDGGSLISIDIVLLRASDWTTREIPPPTFLLGNLISSTTRIEIVAPTGLGKTNFALALATAMAAGIDFLHWRGSGSAQNILYIDGEMSRRLMQSRIRDAVRRHHDVPASLYVLNREDFPDLAPLNSEAGQKFIDAVIERIGGADCVVFDNIQSLLIGDMKEEEPWQQTLAWVRDLTRRNIGQVWIHHTGHDESHGYGSKTREWQLDTVMLLESVDRPDADVAFLAKFIKARERTPENRSDFANATITLAGDAWASEWTRPPAHKRPAKDHALELLEAAIAREGQIPAANGHIPPHTLCVTQALWRRTCEAGSISEASPAAAEKAFRRAAKKLVDTHHVGTWNEWVWVVR